MDPTRDEITEFAEKCADAVIAVGRMLADVVHGGGEADGGNNPLPDHIDIPDDLSREELIVTPEQMGKESITRGFGNKWYDSLQSAVLLVPSVVTQVDRNILINPKHPDFGRIVPGELRPVYWDSRLFRA